jgi:hypothetical protein
MSDQIFKFNIVFRVFKYKEIKIVILNGFRITWEGDLFVKICRILFNNIFSVFYCKVGPKVVLFMNWVENLCSGLVRSEILIVC